VELRRGEATSRRYNITDTLITTRFLSTGFGRLPPQVSAAGDERAM
jgi:hypothetical protein